MVKCVCGKDISAVPDWLGDVKVQFVCNNCPNRDVQGITQVDLTGGKAAEEEAKSAEAKKADVDDTEDEEEEEEELDLELDAEGS